jgi:hypothetical protein
MTDTDRVATQELLAEVLRLRARNRQLEAENAALQAAYTRRTQLALAAGLVRFVVTGDAP